MTFKSKVIKVVISVMIFNLEVIIDATIYPKTDNN